MKAGTVLIVEDDSEIRDLLADFLATEGYGAISVRNGKEALNVLHDEEPVCMILLDLRMPEFDGWSFLEARQSFGLAPGIPTVVMSASKLDRPLVGVSDYLSKPLDVEQLLAVVRSHCGGTMATA